MHRFLEFAVAVRKHWGALVTGGAAIGLLGIWQGTGHSVRGSVYWAIAIIALFIAFYKAWQDKAEQVDRVKDALAASEETIKQTEARLYDGRPLLVLRVAEIAGSREERGIIYDKSPKPPVKRPPKFTISIQNCGGRAARWVTLEQAKSWLGNYRMNFSRVLVVEPGKDAPLGYEVCTAAHHPNNAATIAEFLGDNPNDSYVVWYDIKIKFRDTDESMQEDTARLSYWPSEQVLSSSEVPYTRRQQ